MKEEELQKWVKELWGDDPIPAELVPHLNRLTARKYVEWELVETVHQWLALQLICGEPCRIVAPARTGKTRLCELFALKHKPEKQPGRRDHVPVLYFQAPEDCSPGEFFILLLEALIHNTITSTKIVDLRRQAEDELEKSKVRMLIVDEANFLKAKTFSEIRRLHDKLGISIVLVGTDRLDAVIKRDEQVYDRFRTCYRFGILTGDKFKDIVQTWEDEIVRLPVPSNLATSKTLLKLLQEKTGGKVGHLDRILRKAAILALRRSANKIDKKILDEVLAYFN